MYCVVFFLTRKEFLVVLFFFSSRRRHTRWTGDWSSDVCSSDLEFGYAGSLQDLLGAGPMSQVNGSVIANGTRTPNVIMWDSANMGGITARVAYSTAFSTNLTGVSSDEGSGKGGAGSSGGALTAAVRYSRGPLGLGASYWTATPETANSNPGGEQRSLRLWGGYTLPMGLKVGLGFDNSQRRVTGLV